jgi:hypothetical protein
MILMAICITTLFYIPTALYTMFAFRYTGIFSALLKLKFSLKHMEV